MSCNRKGLLLACALVAGLAPGRWTVAQAHGDFGAARFGMTEQEVLDAFAGKATRLADPEKLADGQVVSLAMPDEVIGSTAFRVRFVFDPAGKLAAVSQRTDPARYFGPEVFEATRKAITERLGPPARSSADDNFIDMRQVTWRTGKVRVDVKYIPGVVVVLHTPDRAPEPPAR